MNWVVLLKLRYVHSVKPEYGFSLTRIFSYQDRQKQSFAGVFQIRCSEKFSKFHSKTSKLESLYDKFTPTQVFYCDILKFFMNIFFYRTPLVTAYGQNFRVGHILHSVKLCNDNACKSFNFLSKLLFKMSCEKSFVKNLSLSFFVTTINSFFTVVPII